jgi:hypothetical protein
MFAGFFIAKIKTVKNSAKNRKIVARKLVKFV